jgi:hypothetical protein
MTRGRSWDVRWVVRVDVEVGAVEGLQRPWCRERIVRVGGAEALLLFVFVEDETRLPRRG